MNAISRSNRLHQRVTQQLVLMEQSDQSLVQLSPSFVLLIEQWVLALCLEANEKLEAKNLHSLHDVISLDAADIDENQFVKAIVRESHEPGHWLNELRLQRKDFLEPQVQKATANVIVSTQVESPNRLWVNELENLMNSIREFSQEY